MKITLFFGLLSATLLLCGCGDATSSEDVSLREEATMEEVNQALATWYTYKASYPSNINELTEAPFFKKKLPTPPPGQKLVIDHRNGRAVFVRE